MPHATPIRQTGGPEVLNWTAVDVGEPRSGQVRMRQEAAGLNWIDLKGAGTVETVGPDVRGLKVGDRVACPHRAGSFLFSRTLLTPTRYWKRATAGSAILTI